MPLTPIQARALRTIAANRSPDSYLAGAAVLHREPDSPRSSRGLDLFHDLADSVARCAETDAAALDAAGFELTWLLRGPAFYRAVLSSEGEQLHLGALAWAACGKDPGFTPGFLLEQAGRHACCSQADLDRLRLRQPLDLRSLKRKWLKALEEARELVDALPPGEVGMLYLDGERPVTPDPRSDRFGELARHEGSIRGAWPVVG